PPASRLLSLRRVVLVAVGLLILTSVLLSAYFIRKSKLTDKQTVEVALPRAPGKERLAVMYFENQSGDAEMNWLREGLTDMLITDLSRSAKLNVLGRQQLHLILERIGHDPQSNIRLDEALDVARKVQAGRVAL